MEIITSKIPDGATVTAYRNGPLIDLCRGPHIPNTGVVKAMKITKVPLRLPRLVVLVETHHAAHVVCSCLMFIQHSCLCLAVSRTLRPIGAARPKTLRCSVCTAYRIRKRIK